MSPDVIRVEPRISRELTRRPWPGLDWDFYKRFACRYSGFLKIDRPGKYIFYLASDDGSKLVIDGRTLIDNDGVHSMIERSATVSLERGFHELQVLYFNRDTDAGLTLKYRGPATAKQPVPADNLFHLATPLDGLVSLPAAADTCVYERRSSSYYNARRSELRLRGGGKDCCYIRFDLTGVKPPIRSARLRLESAISAYELRWSKGTPKHCLHAVPASDWEECSVHDRSRPKLGNLIRTFTVDTANYFEEDVTGIVRAAIKGNRKVSFAVSPAADCPKTGCYYYSREDTSGRGPKLLIVPGERKPKAK